MWLECFTKKMPLRCQQNGLIYLIDKFSREFLFSSFDAYFEFLRWSLLFSGRNMTKLAIVWNDEGRLKLRTQRQSKRESLIVSSEVKQHPRGHSGRTLYYFVQKLSGFFPSKFKISDWIHQHFQHILSFLSFVNLHMIWAQCWHQKLHHNLLYFLSKPWFCEKIPSTISRFFSCAPVLFY